MKQMAIIGIAVLFLLGCGGGGAAGTSDAGIDAPVCAAIAATWSFSYSCSSGGGSFEAAVTQSGCGVRLTQYDDNTTTPTTVV